MNELEALKIIGRLIINKHDYGDDYIEEIDLIKQALTKQEEMKAKVKRYLELEQRRHEIYDVVIEHEYFDLQATIKDWSKLNEKE